MEQSQPKKKSRTKVAQHEGQLNLNPTFKTWKRKEVELMKRRPKPEGHLKLGTIPKVHIKQKGETLDPTWSRKRKNLVQKLTNLLLFEKLCSRGSENLIRKSWYSREEEERGHMIEIQDLFGPNRGTHKKPQLVIIEGAAGIGKSTLARQVKRAWKEGQLYRNHFQHVFFLSCRELAQYEQLSLAELIAQGQEVPTVPIRQILSHPKELLFILDGIDEPAWVLADQNPELCLHWSQTQPVHTLLGSLLGKSILPGASFMLTARTTALQKIIPYVGQPRRVEVLGFSKFEREVYFRKYFVKESDAIAAFRLVVSNPVLLTLCEVPWVCWLVCTCLKKQMEQGGELSLTLQTTTALCLKYLSLTIPGQHMRTQLRALCSLAAEGICQRRTLFSESNFCKQGLAEDAIATFLKIGILQKQASSLSYSFAHLCLQEFFAVMSYILEDSDERCDGMEFKRTVETLIEVYGRHTLCEEPTVHFLFGLVNEQGMREMKKIFDCKLPLGTELKMLKSTLGNPPYQHHLGLLHCLYESQEEVLLTYVLCNLHLTGPDKNYMEATVSQTNVKHLVIQTDMELMVVTFCIQFCCHVRSLRVNMKGQQGHKLTVASMVL